MGEQRRRKKGERKQLERGEWVKDEVVRSSKSKWGELKSSYS